MKKIINSPENYVEDMLNGIYKAHDEDVKYINGDLRCYCIRKKVNGKVAIVTGGGTGHLPLFLGYVGEGLLDACGVGGVFQSPSPDQIYSVSKEVETGSGVLFLYGNYSGDIMSFDMAADMLEMDGISVRSIVGADDVNSGEPSVRRGIAGILFMYKAAGAKAALGGNLDDVYQAASLAKNNTRSVGFALTPCIIPEKGKANFTLGDNEMAFGMGIHGEPGVWNGPIKTSKELAKESIDIILKDMYVKAGSEVAILVNGLGGTSVEEQYILFNDIQEYLNTRNIKIYKSYIGEYATSMEMMGASISMCLLNDEMKRYLNYPVNTPFIKL